MENKKTVLMTGITGFIGKYTAKKIYKKFNITAIIRPGTDKSRYSDFENEVTFVSINLSDRIELNKFLAKNSFDYILHIGALRGGRLFNSEEYVKANVIATELLMNNAIKNKSKFIFCSSVGVYGAIPVELPANLRTPYKEDNLYHITKIKCEKLIEKAVLDKKINACIVRPAITYGRGDYGFPFTLTKLIAREMLFLPNKRIFIHMTNVDLLADAFARILDSGFESGKIWNIADNEKVCFQDLVDFIYKRLQENKLNAKKIDIDTVVFNKYPKNRILKKEVFIFFTKLAKLFKNELWTSRFELISNSWYFDVKPAFDDLGLKSTKTIPEFKTVVDWYFDLNK